MNTLKEFMIPDLCNIINDYLQPDINRNKKRFKRVLYELLVISQINLMNRKDWIVNDNNSYEYERIEEEKNKIKKKA